MIFKTVVWEILLMILNCISVKLRCIFCVLCFLSQTPEFWFPVSKQVIYPFIFQPWSINKSVKMNIIITMFWNSKTRCKFPYTARVIFINSFIYLFFYFLLLVYCLGFIFWQLRIWFWVWCWILKCWVFRLFTNLGCDHSRKEVEHLHILTHSYL